MRRNPTMFQIYLEATVQGYHAYLDNSSAQIGEILTCQTELNNPHNKYAVAVKNQMEMWLAMCQRNYQGPS